MYQRWRMGLTLSGNKGAAQAFCGSKKDSLPGNACPSWPPRHLAAVTPQWSHQP